MSFRNKLVLLMKYEALMMSLFAFYLCGSPARSEPLGAPLAAVGSLPELSGTVIEYFYRPADGLIVTDTLLRYGVVPTIVRSEKPRTDKSNVITCSADVSAAAI